MEVLIRSTFDDSRVIFAGPFPKRHIRVLMFVVLSTGALCAPAATQDNNRVSNFIRDALDTRGREIVAATADMPADKFSVKLVPEGMTFAQFTLHVAAANYLYCSKIGAVPEPALASIGDTEPKDRLLDRLKSSFDFCAAALAKLDDSNKSEVLTLGETKTSRAMAILTLSSTWADHFAQQGDYLQAAGRIPATARK